MTSLTPSTALGGSEPRLDEIGDIRITEIADTSLAALAMRSGKRAAFKKAATARFNTDLPEPGMAVMAGGHALIWMGPDQFLAESDIANARLAAETKSSFGASASVTDASDSWVRFDVSGPDSVAMLERLSAVDCRSMISGMASRTAVHHMACLILCRDTGQRFSVYGPRSSAASLHHALVTAAASL